MLKFNHHATTTACERCGARTDKTILYWTGKATLCGTCVRPAPPKPDPFSGHLFGEFAPKIKQPTLF